MIWFGLHLYLVHKGLHEGKAHAGALTFGIRGKHRLHGLFHIRYAHAAVLHRHGQGPFLHICGQVQIYGSPVSPVAMYDCIGHCLGYGCLHIVHLLQGGVQPAHEHGRHHPGKLLVL